MRSLYLSKIFGSNYCKTIFIVSLFISYFLVPPRLFKDLYAILAVAFMLSFSLTITCMAWTIKQRALLAKKKGASIFAVVATAIGISSLQLCGIGTPICYASLGMNFFAALVPSSLFFPLMDYSMYIVVFSILFQMFSLHKMGFFKRV